MATMYARLGLGICVPHYYLYWLQVLPGLDVHWRWWPSRELRGFSSKLQQAHDERPK